MANVIFHFEDGTQVKASAAIGENLLEVARKVNVAIDAPCSGKLGEADIPLVPGLHHNRRGIDDLDGHGIGKLAIVFCNEEICTLSFRSEFRSRKL